MYAVDRYLWEKFKHSPMSIFSVIVFYENCKYKNKMVFISSFKQIAKPFKVRDDKIVIDDYLFQCHYKLTTNILLMFCILVTTNNLIGLYLRHLKIVIKLTPDYNCKYSCVSLYLTHIIYYYHQQWSRISIQNTNVPIDIYFG